MPKLPKAMALNIQRLRNEKGLTQEELARSIGMTRASIIRYESGKGGVSRPTIAKFASFFRVEETDIVDGHKLSSNDYKALYELSLAVESLRKDNEFLKGQVHKSWSDLPSDIAKFNESILSIDPKIRKTLLKAWENDLHTIINKLNSKNTT